MEILYGRMQCVLQPETAQLALSMRPVPPSPSRVRACQRGNYECTNDHTDEQRDDPLFAASNKLQWSTTTRRTTTPELLPSGESSLGSRQSPARKIGTASGNVVTCSKRRDFNARHLRYYAVGMDSYERIRDTKVATLRGLRTSLRPPLGRDTRLD